MKELLGLTDGRLLVHGLQTLRVGFAFEVAPHLPVTAGVGLENPQLARVVGNGRYGRKNGQCAVARRQVVGVVCCGLPCEFLHAHKRSF